MPSLPLHRRKKFKGQTVLEYVLTIAVIVLPLAYAIREMLSDSDPQKKDNFMRVIVSDSHGTEKRLGIIGRPYP